MARSVVWRHLTLAAWQSRIACLIGDLAGSQRLLYTVHKAIALVMECCFGLRIFWLRLLILKLETMQRFTSAHMTQSINDVKVVSVSMFSRIRVSKDLRNRCQSILGICDNYATIGICNNCCNGKKFCICLPGKELEIV